MSKIVKETFGKMPDGQAVDLYRMINERGSYVEVLNLGITIRSIVVYDKEGIQRDIVLGYDSVEEYLENDGYLGATIGRYANRIGGAKFLIDGVEHKVDANEGDNALHGGGSGFDKRLWTIEEVDAKTLRCHLISEDGDMGYPGQVEVTLDLEWTDDQRLTFTYHATTDAPTVINLTNHSYFNLSGSLEPTILHHELNSQAIGYTPIDESSIPLGSMDSVEGTPFDLRDAVILGDHFAEHGEVKDGFDHNFILLGEGLKNAVGLYSPATDIRMVVRTTEPGIQIYTGVQLTNRTGKQGATYDRFAGICLETQHYPDSPNQEAFPQTILRPGEEFTSQTEYHVLT